MVSDVETTSQIKFSEVMDQLVKQGVLPLFLQDGAKLLDVILSGPFGNGEIELNLLAAGTGGGLVVGLYARTAGAGVFHGGSELLA